MVALASKRDEQENLRRPERLGVSASGAVKSILERNARVEADKAWETSVTRRLIIFGATYVIVLYFLILVNAPNPFLNALVPALAFAVSTLSVSALKKFWLERVYKK